MSDYKVTDTELISVANAIRTKGGTSAQLQFPDEFVSAINAISTGGGTFPYYELQDGTLGVEVLPGGLAKWYFNGYNKQSDDINITDEALTPYLPYVETIIRTYSYSGNKITQNGHIGFYQKKIRSWSIDLGSTIAGTFYGTLYVFYDKNISTGVQSNPYEEPIV